MLKLFGSLFLALVLLVGFLPSILSIPSVHQFLLRHSPLKIQELKMSWMDGVKIRGLSLNDSIEVEEFEWAGPLYKLLLDLTRVYEGCKLKGNLTHFPLQSLKTQAPDLVAFLEPIIGETFDAKVDLQPALQGMNCSLEISNSDFQLLLEGSISIQKSTLFFLEPLVGSFTEAQKPPIAIVIDDKGFQIPLSGFTLEGICIASMTLTPDKQSCRASGILKLIVSLLKMSETAANEVQIWFTPIHLSLSRGTLDVKRTDFLVANRFPLAAWGNVDLCNNQVLMTLGISARAISRAFFVFTTQPDALVQIPIHGPIDQPNFNVARATTKIMAMRIAQTPSPPTALLGMLLNVASSVGVSDPPPPPPTTTPFPWDLK